MTTRTRYHDALRHAWRTAKEKGTPKAPFPAA